jgi:hypothetical protein
MKHFPRSLKGIVAAIAAVGILALGGSMPAFAAGVTVTGVTITGASPTFAGLTFNNTGAFAGVTLDGTQKTTTETLTIGNVVDPSGTGDGWNVSLGLTQLSQWNSTDTYTGTYTLPFSSIKVTTAPMVSLVDSSSSAASTVTPVSTTTPLDTGVGVKLLSATTGGGMGSYAISNATMTLTVPAKAYAVTYKTDATVSLTSTP